MVIKMSTISKSIIKSKILTFKGATAFVILSLCCLTNFGCSQYAYKKNLMQGYSIKEESLNAPIPVSSYVNVTQQIKDNKLGYVTCEQSLCPAFKKKYLAVSRSSKKVVINN